MNKIKAIVEKIERKNSFLLVKLKYEDDKFISLFLQNSSNFSIKEGQKVFMLFNESEVSIAKGECKISLRNRFKSRIINIESNNILCLITLKYKNEIIKSLITFNALKDLDLKIGDEVIALVKSNELSIMEL